MGSGFMKFVKMKILPIFYLALAIYTMYTLILTAAEVAREKLNLQQSPPDHSCIPFFDDMLNWHAKPENKDSIVLYDFIRGQAIARVCTNQSAANLTKAITAFDEAEAYTPFSHYGCPLTKWRREIEDPFNDGCVRIGSEAMKYTCSEILNWEPCDDRCANESISPTPVCCNRDRENCCTGFGFQWDVQNLGGQEIPGREGVFYTDCTIRFEYLEGLPKCDGTYVGIFQTPARNLEIFYWCVVAVPIIVLIAQCYMLHLFDPAPPYDDDYYVSFAMRGIPGPLYLFWWVYIADRDEEFPEARLKLPAFLACAAQDAVEGLAAPLIAILGCELGRFPIPTALLFLKAIKFLVDAVMYFKDFSCEDAECCDDECCDD